MLLEVRGLRVGYHHGTVLHGVDLDLDQGETLALLGRNGAGKSTLLTTIMGFLKPAAGTVRLNGVDLVRWPIHHIAGAGVALVPQGRRIWPTLSVGEHLDLTERGSRAAFEKRRWTQAAVCALLPRLAERRRQLAGTLSGGEQQMLAIARALLTQPKLILADEPSEGLAPLVVDQIGGILREVANEGVAVLLVEQDLRLAFNVARRMVVMARGELVHHAETDAFRRDPKTVQRLLGVEG